jgi:hypothetical protein
MRARKSDLLNEIGINKADIEYSIENAGLILGGYEATSLRNERQVSFLYDIISLVRSRNSGLKISPRIYTKITNLLLHPENVRAILKLKNDQKRRRNYRSL